MGSATRADTRVRSPGSLVAAAAALSLGFLVVLWTKPWGTHASVLLDDVVENVAVALACACCARRAWQSEGRDRRGWALLAAFTGLWLAGGVIWFAYDITGATIGFPSIADVAFLLAVPVAVVGFLLMPSPGTSTTRVRTVLDGALIAGSVLFIAWALIIGPLLTQADSSRKLNYLVALAYPLGDVVILAVAITLFARAGRSRPTALLLSGGMAAIAVSDGAYAWISLFRPAAAGDLTGAGWLLGFLLIAVAAATSTAERQGAVMAQPARPASPAVIYGSVMAFLLVAGYRLAAGRGLDGGLGWMAVIISFLVLVRQWLTTVEVGVVQHQLRALAFRDGLTGLANRSKLETTVEERLDRGLPITMVLLDVDKFKAINDTYGHRTGDQVLVEVARRLETQVDADSLVARIGGDEFAVMVAGALAPQDASAMADRLENALRWPLTVDGHILRLSASFGVAVPSADTGSLGEVLREADLAMYTAKRAGGGAFSVSTGRDPSLVPSGRRSRDRAVQSDRATERIA
jgi:diguanylate cyclase (GGDEF)-like protein